MWITYDGYGVLQQTQAQSCGLCCVGMVLNLRDSDRQEPEDSLAALSLRLAPGEYKLATKDRVGFVKMATAKADPGLIGIGDHRAVRGSQIPQDYGQRETLGSGTAATHLVAVLREYGVTARKATAAKAAMQAACRETPTMMLVEIPNLGHHWVLVIGRETRKFRASIYTILDPVGFVTTNAGSIHYRPTHRRGRYGEFREAITITR